MLRCCGASLADGMRRRPLQRNLAEHLLWLAKDRAVAVPTLAKLHSLSWKVHSALEEVRPSAAAEYHFRYGVPICKCSTYPMLSAKGERRSQETCLCPP